MVQEIEMSVFYNTIHQYAVTNTYTCDSRDESQKHCVQWKMTKKKHIFYDSLVRNIWKSQIHRETT